MIVNALVEGLIDEAVARRLVEDAGLEFGVCYGKKGVAYIEKNIISFNNASHAITLLTLVDFMDTRISCPPSVLRQWLPHPRANMLLRIVVREIESWLMADREQFAAFLQIPAHRVPLFPEQVSDPKQTVVNLARLSRSPKIRESFIPESGTSSVVGKLYASEMIRFIYTRWRIDHARQHAPSLDRAALRLKNLTAGIMNR